MNKESLPSVRIALESDADCVAAIARAQWSVIYEEYRKQLGDALYEIIYRDALDAKEIAIRTAISQKRCLIAEWEGVVCGFCTYQIQKAVGALTNNAVSQEYKGHGIAGMLYSRVFEIMKKNGCTAVKVTTGGGDIYAPARRAYEKAGFSENLEQITYYKML